MVVGPVLGRLERLRKSATMAWTSTCEVRPQEWGHSFRNKAGVGRQLYGALLAGLDAAACRG